jgi:cytochrome P450
MSLHQYLIDLVKKKMEISPGESPEDAVSDLAERVNAGEISVKEAAQLGTGLLIAGHETTANMIGIGILALLEHPEQAALLRDSDDPKFIANAVEELMRYLSIIQTGQRRIATEDIEIGGETIRAGEGIIIDLAPANWDGAAYPEPDELDLARDAGQQLGFGYGRHQCVGQQLARAEMQIVFPTLLQRIPTLKLAIPFEEVPFKHDRLAYGVYELPVAW